MKLRRDSKISRGVISDEYGRSMPLGLRLISMMLTPDSRISGLLNSTPENLTRIRRLLPSDGYSSP
jgi:hypothetical protein